jgi:ribosomal protein L10
MAEHKVQQYKVEAVQKLKGWFKESPDLIFSDFRGLTFPQMTDLRAKLGDRKTPYRVVRNAFAKIALSRLEADPSWPQWIPASKP